MTALGWLLGTTYAWTAERRQAFLLCMGGMWALNQRRRDWWLGCL